MLLSAIVEVVVVTVSRFRQEVQIPTNHVVRGDVVVLGTGDVVPADRPSVVISGYLKTVLSFL